LTKTDIFRKIFAEIASFILNYLLFFDSVDCASLDYFDVLNSKKWEYLCDTFLKWVIGGCI
jgi:hypothetical protein